VFNQQEKKKGETVEEEPTETDPLLEASRGSS
jgi:hypothetical protein